jgi:hypothetical protein
MKKAILALLVALALPAVVGAASTPALSEQGSGKAGAAESSCAGINQGCMSVTGTFKGKPIAAGSFTAKFTVDWSRAKKTSTGATCATGGGSVELTGKGGDALSLSETGKLCKGGKSQYPFRFNGTYSITGGAGKYESTGVGSGKASWQQLPAGKIRVFAVGGFSMKTRPPG